MTTRRWVVLGIALVVVGLALPWHASRLDVHLLPVYLPGACTTSSFDGSLDCGPGSTGFSTVASVRPAVMGFGQPIRVFAVVAALLVGSGWRRRSTSTVGWGLGVAALGVVAAGVSTPSGPAVFVLGVLVIALVLRREDLLPRRWAPAGGRRT
ncbi:hypothetical protein [Nakamurella sp. PAMC28650]|jgi:hypothetical protein|uniref:hypothetical protein n=1 Tax=Nakamurella sp. PAMC28650 TaxID=2762325 RepID=UPI00164E216D|nr:hypothetical protein [Nakamurella sp. PAMC28650]QNK82390.1 hypothetical protein H7F38_06570 [Nakamurella sp. PAMC28650]